MGSRARTPPPDTIAAIATAAGRGAVGVIRVSGAEVPRIAAELLGAVPTPRSAAVRRFLGEDGRVLDRGIALYFPAPASFTGEHVLEVQGHGGAVVMGTVLQRLLALGCRLARPGEFSERAFLNGKMDVAQAEAIADLIDAGTTAAARAAVRSMQGEFSAQIRALQAKLTELRVYVEAAIDFPDEEIDFLSNSALNERLSRVFAQFNSVTAAARQGALLRNGLTVVIAGKPNAGKSSLLNRLVGDDVAIVTDLPGTTRDLLRQQVHLDGLPLTLIDTAGLRMAVDVIEAEGIRRAKAEMQRADRVLYVVDASVEEPALPPHLEGLPPAVPVTIVMNKIDLVGVAAGSDVSAGVARLRLSARTGEGMELLRLHLKASAGYQGVEAGAFSARQRHLDALDRAHGLMRSAVATLRLDQAFELFAEDLRLAQRALSEVTGEMTSEDLLGQIFGSFCIGK
jgi:tRNA modification GTPase